MEAAQNVANRNPAMTVRAAAQALDDLNNGVPVEHVFPDEPLYDGELVAVVRGLRRLLGARTVRPTPRR